MKTIRKGVFETNSSSTHSLTIVPKEEYEKWEDGEVYFDRWNQKFITLEEGIKEEKESDYLDYDTEEEWKESAMEGLVTPEEFFKDYYLQTFERSFTTPSGDKMVAFGEYGRDG